MQFLYLKECIHKQYNNQERYVPESNNLQYMRQ